MSKRLVKKGASWLLRFLALAFLLAIAFISLALFEEIYKKKQIDEEIKKLEEKAKKFEKENSQIQEKINYLESRDFQEKEVRDKLSLHLEGENVVVLKPGSQKKYSEEENQENYQDLEKPASEIPNWKKWRDYFFSY